MTLNLINTILLALIFLVLFIIEVAVLRALSGKKETPVQISEEPVDMPEETPFTPEGEYSGVLHMFRKDGKKRERPVMFKQYRGKTVFFEYDENQKKVNLNGNNSKMILAVLQDNKEFRNFKAYKLK